MQTFKITYLEYTGQIHTKIIQNYGLVNIYNDIISNGINDNMILEIKKIPNEINL